MSVSPASVRNPVNPPAPSMDALAIEDKQPDKWWEDEESPTNLPGSRLTKWFFAFVSIVLVVLDYTSDVLLLEKKFPCDDLDLDTIFTANRQTFLIMFSVASAVEILCILSHNMNRKALGGLLVLILEDALSLCYQLDLLFVVGIDSDIAKLALVTSTLSVLKLLVVTLYETCCRSKREGRRLHGEVSSMVLWGLPIAVFVTFLVYFNTYAISRISKYSLYETANNTLVFNSTGTSFDLNGLHVSDGGKSISCDYYCGFPEQEYDGEFLLGGSCKIMTRMNVVGCHLFAGYLAITSGTPEHYCVSNNVCTWRVNPNSLFYADIFGSSECGTKLEEQARIDFLLDWKALLHPSPIACI